MPTECSHGCGNADLTAIHRVGQQRVSRRTAPESVSRTNIEDAADYDCAWPVHRAATGRDTIDGAVLAFRVHIPHDAAMVGRIGA